MKQRVLVNLTDQSQLDCQQLEEQLKECHETSFNNLKNSIKSIKMDRHKNKPANESHSQTLAPCLTLQSLKGRSQLTQTFTGYEPPQTSGNRSRISLIKTIARRPMTRPRKKRMLQLKDVIMNQKVNGLKELFCKKIKRNNPYSEPVQYQFQNNAYNKSFFERTGFELKENQEKLLSMLCIFNIISSIFIFTLSIALPQIKEHLAVWVIELFGAVIYFTEILINFTTIKFTLGKKLETLKDIGKDYIDRKFPVDFVNLVIILLHTTTQHQVLVYFRIFVLLKIPDCMEKIEKLQVFFIDNYYNEQYWSLVKVFLFNFCFAHMLAVILLVMSEVNSTQNWLETKNLSSSPWYQKYIWSYYWGTTIMLTIGFGDMTPVCYQQALCMIFIQTISCIVLAYNINCVGSLIAYIRSQDIEKSKNLKIFKKLVDKSHISQPLSEKINSYIEEHTNIKKLFNIEEEVQFVEKLPTAFRTDYLKEANKTIFQRLFFFSHLMEKTLFALAENIVMKITHPEEVILTHQRNFDVFILKHGEIGYVSRKAKRKYNSYVFDRVKIDENRHPFLLNTNFMTKNRSNYGIKSIVYSVLYCLKFQNLMDILRQAHLDYELYCRMRDKKRNKVDQFQVVPCQFCQNQKHTKFSCPKLHFLPFQQHIMHRYIHRQKIDKNARQPDFERLQQPRESSLMRFLFNKDIYDERIKQDEIAESKMVKKQKFVIDQLKKLDNVSVEQETNKAFTQTRKLEAMTSMQNKFLESTAEIIKININKAMGVENAEDDIWLLDLDCMKNYKDYFAENNPCNLLNSFSLELRLKKMNEDNGLSILGNVCMSAGGLDDEFANINKSRPVSVQKMSALQ